MDKLFIGDIPKEFTYADFNNYYIDLYNKSTGNNETLQYYRIYLYDNQFVYETGSRNFGNYNYDTFQKIDVTDNICYRRDFPSICVVTFCFVIFGIFLLNIITSIIRKGGVFSDLL